MESSSSSSASLNRRASRTCYRPSPSKLVLVVSWTENNPRKRFYRCPNYWVGRKCKYFQWVDDEICPRGKVLIPEQRHIILRLQAEDSTCKKREKCLAMSLILALLMCGICLCIILVFW
ncbi:hypothetical protein RGQ29_003848 [Quercus rubra]|uniref:GRF-type domain-containing protein n=1 Tax=Quercus rubra TaxID=3512 RepID=A0AAN7IFK6_QUERU|nr:hypothetical protein RGQ29_003848 [Quercus rubra]